MAQIWWDKNEKTSIEVGKIGPPEPLSTLYPPKIHKNSPHILLRLYIHNRSEWISEALFCCSSGRFLGGPLVPSWQCWGQHQIAWDSWMPCGWKNQPHHKRRIRLKSYKRHPTFRSHGNLFSSSQYLQETLPPQNNDFSPRNKNGRSFHIATSYHIIIPKPTPLPKGTTKPMAPRCWRGAASFGPVSVAQASQLWAAGGLGFTCCKVGPLPVRSGGTWGP